MTRRAYYSTDACGRILIAHTAWSYLHTHTSGTRTHHTVPSAHTHTEVVMQSVLLYNILSMHTFGVCVYPCTIPWCTWFQLGRAGTRVVLAALNAMLH